MYCPKCHAEYREGFTRCADCQVDLVDTPTEQDDDPGWFASLFGGGARKKTTRDPEIDPATPTLPHDAVLVFQTPDRAVMQGMVDLFNEHQIPIFPRFRTEGGEHSPIFGGCCGVELDKIFVHPEHEDEANALIDEANIAIADGSVPGAELPPELAQATDEPDPEPDDDLDDDSLDDDERDPDPDAEDGHEGDDADDEPQGEFTGSRTGDPKRDRTRNSEGPTEHRSDKTVVFPCPYCAIDVRIPAAAETTLNEMPCPHCGEVIEFVDPDEDDDDAQR